MACLFTYGRTGAMSTFSSIIGPASSAIVAVQSSPSAISSCVRPSATIVSDMAMGRERATTCAAAGRA